MIQRSINEKAITILSVYVPNKKAFAMTWLFTYKKNPTVSIKKLLEWVSEFCKIADYKT